MTEIINIQPYQGYYIIPSKGGQQSYQTQLEGGCNPAPNGLNGTLIFEKVLISQKFIICNLYLSKLIVQTWSIIFFLTVTFSP